jgi:hypothetical protein
VILHTDPVTDTWQICSRVAGVDKPARQVGRYLTLLIADDVLVAINRDHASDGLTLGERVKNLFFLFWNIHGGNPYE